MREQEEEEVSLMNTDPTGAVEYKIIRSATGAFKDPASFRAALNEEARAGWELVEKLDNSRARLRRSTECRQRDAELSQDPYRTQVGMSETARTLYIIASVLVSVALLLGAVAAMVQRQ